MVNKKGWMRIMEAVLAILLLTSLLFVIYAGQKTKVSQSTQIYNFEYNLLNNLAENDSLRNAVLSENRIVVDRYFNKTIPFELNSSFKICGLVEDCLWAEGDLPFVSVYVVDRVISGNLTFYDPKKLRLAVWYKSDQD